VKRREGRLERCADGGDIAMAAHLCDEAAAGAEGAVNTCEESLMAGNPRDPVEGGVGEDGVELLKVRKRCGVVLLNLEVPLAGGVEHGRRSIHTSEDRSCGGKLFGEGAVAAADVQDLFT
jgi:hypothetical protein